MLFDPWRLFNFPTNILAHTNNRKPLRHLSRRPWPFFSGNSAAFCSNDCSKDFERLGSVRWCAVAVLVVFWSAGVSAVTLSHEQGGTPRMKTTPHQWGAGASKPCMGFRRNAKVVRVVCACVLQETHASWKRRRQPAKYISFDSCPSLPTSYSTYSMSDCRRDCAVRQSPDRNPRI